MTTVEIVDLPADRLAGDALVVPLFEDHLTLDGPAAVVDWRLDGLLARMLLAGELSGRAGEQLAVRGNGKFASPWVLIGGCGRWQSLEREDYVVVVDRLLKMAAKADLGELALCLPPADAVAPPEIERIVRERLFGANRPALCRLSRIARFA